MIDSNPTSHPCASNRFISFVRASLSSFTHFQHRTARVARYSIPLRCIPYRATLAVSNAGPDENYETGQDINVCLPPCLGGKFVTYKQKE